MQRRNQELSSGQRTLVSIVKAVLHRPELLILDEPTASLDPDIAARVREAMLAAHRRDGTSLLVTSHNMREVEVLCDRVVLLSQGRIVADDSPSGVALAFDVDDLEGAFMAVAEAQRGTATMTPRGTATMTPRGTATMTPRGTATMTKRGAS